MKFRLIPLFIIILLSIGAHASHLRAGYITVEQISGANLTCRITILVYTNSSSTVQMGSNFDNGKDYILDFGDGTRMTVPETFSTPRPDLGNNISVASFTILHTYAATGSYLVSYIEPSRNAGIINIQESSLTNFYTETFFVLDVGRIFKTPETVFPPIFNSLSGMAYSESWAQIDENDYQLIYQMITPQSGRHLNVSNYRLPESFSVDPISGLLSWDSRFNGIPTVGEFAFAIKTYQINDEKLMGYMVRDFQIVVDDEEEVIGTLSGGEFENARVYTAENTTINLRVEAGSALNIINLELTSELEEFPASFSYTIEDSVHNNIFYKVAKIVFTNSIDVNRTNPYIINARATFSGPEGIVKKDLVYVVASKDIYYEMPLVLKTTPEKKSTLVIYPNPVKNTLQIQMPGFQDVLLVILDLNGKEFFYQKLKSASTIDVSHLPSGIYVAKFLVDGKIVTHKVVKE